VRLRLAAALVLVGMWPAIALAAPTVASIIDQAIEALRTQCYEARMRFATPLDGGAEQVVRIYHVAPDLYRVEPLINGQPGDIAYIENSDELVRLNLVNGRQEKLPKLQFSVSDLLTMKFLRDLGRLPGTTVLSGMVGSMNVLVLRQEPISQKPYKVTVGVDQSNFFPVYLLVTGDDGRRYVYYEMEEIKYRPPGQLPDKLFIIPPVKPQQRQAAPRGASKATLQANSPGTRTLPLYPMYLPDGYHLDAISMLNYVPGGDQAATPALVYQFEIYGPRLVDLISIFQTRSGAVDLRIRDVFNQENTGWVVREKGGWVVTVIGSLSMESLLKIVAGLAESEEDVKRLVDKTLTRDRILREASAD